MTGMVSALDKIVSVITTFFGGYWLGVILGIVHVHDKATSATFLWILIAIILRVVK